jgi:hypothetical protein
LNKNDNIVPFQPKSDTAADPAAADARLANGQARRRRQQEEYEAQRDALADEAVDERLEQYRQRCEVGERWALYLAMELCHGAGRAFPQWLSAIFLKAARECDAAPPDNQRKRPSFDEFLPGNHAPGSRHFTTAAVNLRSKQAIVEAVELARQLEIRGIYDWARRLLELYSDSKEGYDAATNYEADSIKVLYRRYKRVPECRNQQIAITLKVLSRKLPDPK